MSRNMWKILLVLSLLLAACAGAAASEAHAGTMRLNDGRSFNYTLEIPASWNGKYEVQKAEVWPTGQMISFVYTAEPKYPIFNLTALTEEQWAEIQNDPGVMHLKDQDGAVFIYTIALENLYSGSQAEEFQQMAGDVQGILNSLEVTAVSSDAQQAQEVLIAFFDHLHNGRYAEAATLYSGSYETMAAHNPDFDATDHAGLFQQACTVNGAISLVFPDWGDRKDD